MGDQPYHNEPGFEREKMLEAEGRRGGKTASSVQELTNKYNLKVQHETLRIAVCDLLEDLCNPETENSSIFPEIIKWHFLLYYQEYLSIANEHLEETGAFETTEFEFPRNTMMGSYDFKSIVTRIEGIKDVVEKETREWQTKGAEATARGVQSYDCQQINMALQKFNRVELDGISASPQDGNIFVWDVTIMGGLGGGWWENGIYTLKLVFPPDFPDSPPRPKFDTNMFHPQVSLSSYPTMLPRLSHPLPSPLPPSRLHPIRTASSENTLNPKNSNSHRSPTTATHS
jgi:ubiquitin-conjugating enzyme E2 Z